MYPPYGAWIQSSVGTSCLSSSNQLRTTLILCWLVRFEGLEHRESSCGITGGAPADRASMSDWINLQVAALGFRDLQCVLCLQMACPA